jgi:hypothetical protein
MKLMRIFSSKAKLPADGGFDVQEEMPVNPSASRAKHITTRTPTRVPQASEDQPIHEKRGFNPVTNFPTHHNRPADKADEH